VASRSRSSTWHILAPLRDVQCKDRASQPRGVTAVAAPKLRLRTAGEEWRFLLEPDAAFGGQEVRTISPLLVVLTRRHPSATRHL
jgi:hypothetical protein